ncbi:Os07g0184900, partial [Oryza sativa Japonica Group]
HYCSFFGIISEGMQLKGDVSFVEISLYAIVISNYSSLVICPC